MHLNLPFVGQKEIKQTSKKISKGVSFIEREIKSLGS